MIALLNSCQFSLEPNSESDAQPPASVSLPDFKVESSEAALALGMQLSSLAPFETAIAFKNLFKQSRPWMVIRPGQPFANVAKNQDRQFFERLEKQWFDPEGYPKQVPFTIADINDPATGQPVSLGVSTVMQVDHHFFPEGRYTLKFTGKGRVLIHRDASLDVRGRGGITVAQFLVKPHQGIWLEIRESSPSDPVRNLQVILPGFEQDDLEQQPFNPVYLERLKGFSYLRVFGNATKTAFAGEPAQLISAWADRIKPTSARYVTGGQGGWGSGWPLELVTQLANQVDADLWWSCGYAVSDEYLKNAAQLLNSQLQPQHRIYLEYSNEVWNQIFPQHRYAQGQGKAMGLQPEAGIKFVVLRSLALFRIFRQVLGSDIRLIEVLPGWNNSPDYNRQLLQVLKDLKINPDQIQPDVLAVAPYFDLRRIKTVNDLPHPTVDAVIQLLQQKVQAGSTGKLAEIISLAQAQGLEMVAYESGQHLVDRQRREGPLTDLYVSANRDPRMYDLYLKYYANLHTLGFTAATHFNYVSRYSKYGSWGALEYLDQPLEQAPKYRALRQFLAQQRSRLTNSEVE